MKTKDFLDNKHLIVKMFAGSHAYGTALPTSDIDFRGIFCADPINLLTPFFPVREVVDVEEEDTKFYELSHYMKLCLDCNPNLIELLWTNPEDIVAYSPAYSLLRKHRKDFLSSKIAFTTTGYAIAQWKKLKSREKWLNNPQPKDCPKQKDFVSLIQWFRDDKIMPNNFSLELVKNNFFLVPYGSDAFGIYHSVGKQTFNEHDGSLKTQYEIEDRHKLPVPVAIVKFNKQQWNQTKDNWTNYWTWKNNRNKIRGVMEEEFGFDGKNALHLVRLMRMGLEALRDGEIIVKRPDADELISIRNGGWSYKEVVEYADYMDHEIRNVWYKKTELPKKPDIKFAAKILMEVQEMIWDR